MLAVVEHEQELTAGEVLPQAVEHRCGRARAVLHLDAERGRDSRRDIGGITDRRQVGEPDTFAVRIELAVTDLSGEPGLADAAGADDRHDAVPIEQRPGRVDLGAAPDERVGRDGQVRCRGTCRGRGRPRRAERGILFEDRELQLAQLGSRVDAELLGEDRARTLVGTQGVTLPAGAIQRGHELRPEPFAQRMGLHGCFQLADQLGVAAEQQVRLDAVLERREARFFEARDYRASELVLGELDERRAAPQRERAAQYVGGFGRVAVLQRIVAGVRQLVETMRVDRVRRDVERVTTAARDDPVVAEHASQARDLHLQVVPCWLVAAPHILEQLVRGDRASRAEREIDEDRARAGTADVDGLAVVAEHFERAEDAQFQQRDDTCTSSQAVCQRADSTQRDARAVNTNTYLANALARHAWNAHLRGNSERASHLAGHAARFASDGPRSRTPTRRGRGARDCR